MNWVKKLFSGLKTRFIICYLLLTLIPIVLLYRIAYVNAAESAQREIVESQVERAYADRQYMQLVFQNVESKVDLFEENTTLAQIMDNSSHSNRSVMYDYVSEVSDLFAKAKRDDLVDGTDIYTNNATAADILPGFHLMSDLDTSLFPEIYALNRSRVLFQHFWVFAPGEDGLRTRFYAGLFDANVNRVNGILAIDCSRALRAMLEKRYNDGEHVYVLCDGEQVYATDRDTLASQSAAEAMKRLPAGENTGVYLDETARLITHVIRFPDQKLTVCRVYPVPHSVRLPAFFWPVLLSMIALSLILMLLIFHPLNNITALARHMKSVRSIPLQPYPRKSRTSEIITIIDEYNALVERVNDMSRTINQKELLLRNAQIERLQSQLNPHFFYGTLESIRMIAEVENQPEIAEIAYDFSSLMRYSLSKDFFVPLSQEIDIVRQYIAIQKKRIGNRFELIWDNDVDVESWRCPKFVLFSMVENAFTHDVNHSRKKVHITIALRESGDELTLTVTNDGPGIPPERLRQLWHMIAHPEDRKDFTSQNNGRSIFNINDRLQFYYGEDYHFHIDSTPEKQTVCSVTINRNAKFLGEEPSDAEYSAD